MKQLVILIGCPCSGKSTFTDKFLSENTDFRKISFDDIKDEDMSNISIWYKTIRIMFKWLKLAKNTHYEHLNNILQRTEKEFKRRYFELLGSNDNIIVDKTNMTIKSRNRLTATINANKYTITYYVFSVDKETFIKRNDIRYKKTGKYIPLRVYEEFCDMYQIPTYDEKVDNINFL